MICHDCQSALPELLLDPAAPSNAAAREHLKSCPACNQEFQSLEATFALLDTWQAPEPSPYFDQKLAVRLREEQELPPAGWFDRLRSRLLFNTGRQFRPIMAGALAVVLLAAGEPLPTFPVFRIPTSRMFLQLSMICRSSTRTTKRCKRWDCCCRMMAHPMRALLLLLPVVRTYV